jgi:hypothetical protein
MIDYSLLSGCEIVRCKNAVAAGSSDITDATSIDMAEAEWVVFLFLFGAITTNAVTSTEVHQSSDDGVADAYGSLAGSGLTVADDDDNQVFASMVIRPGKRYVKPVVKRATQNAVVDGVLDFVKRKSAPVTHGATVGATEVLVSPAEGTA